MSAFLSHSSKDKYFVRSVASSLGELQVELDEWTLEYQFNAAAIRRALARTELFVLFLSLQSVDSVFVDFELKSTLEERARGGIKDVIVFSVDGTSYKKLPEWLRSLNVVTQLSSPVAVARRIQSRLFELDAARLDAGELYLGRSDDEDILRRALAVPADKTPLAVHIVGHEGIGRRTFLRKTLQSTYPRLFAGFLEISIRTFTGPEEIYRSLYDLHRVGSLTEKISDFTRFRSLSLGS